jgi:prolipoprotein diacylglyceryltransferase
VIFLYLAVEPPMRFAIEFVRGDADRGLYGALSTSQWLAAVMAPAALAALLWQVRRGRAAPIDSVASAYYTQRLDSSTRP